MSSSLSLTPVTPAIYTLIRDRAQRMLDSCSSGGFAWKQVESFRLGEIKLEGLIMRQEDQIGEWETAPERGAIAEVTIEFEITEEMCNISGNAHGGFLAYAVDVASSLPLLCLSGHDRWATSGVSTNINMYYIAAAPLGTLVRIVSRTIAQGKVIAVMEARIEERTTGKLLAKGTHVKQDNTPHQYKL